MPLCKVTTMFILDTPDIDTAEEYVKAFAEDVKEAEKDNPILKGYKFIVSRELLEGEVSEEFC